MQIETKENKMGVLGIPKLLFSISVPIIISMLVQALYNVVDRIYIGHMPGVGDLALTGVGVCMPGLIDGSQHIDSFHTHKAYLS